MRIGEFFEALTAYREERDSDRRHIGELIRGATYKLWNLQVEEKHKIKDPKKFWPLPWDVIIDEGKEVTRLRKMTDEQRQEEANKFFSKIKK